MESGRGLIGIFLVVVVALSLVGGLMRFSGKALSKQKREVLAEQVANKEAMREEAAYQDDLTKALPAVCEALETGDIEGALTLWSAFDIGKIGIMKQPELAAQRVRLGKAVDLSYQKLLAGLAADEVAAEELDFFVYEFEFVSNDPELRSKYNTALRNISIDRAKLMPGRVMIEADDFEIFSAIAEVLPKYWPADYPVQPTYGKALSDLERNAAFAAYKFKIQTTKRTQTVLGQPIEWPSKITIQFEVTKPSPCPTSWDGIKKIEIDVPPLKPLPAGTTDMQAIERMNRELVDAIAAALEPVIPIWAPVSEMGGTSLKNKEGNYSVREAAAFYLNSPDKFEVRLAEDLRVANTTASQAGLRTIIAELYREKYASWFEKSLAFVPVTEIAKNAAPLSSRPFFGGYVPLARCLALARLPAPIKDLNAISPAEVIKVIYPVFMENQVPGRYACLDSRFQSAAPELAEAVWELAFREPDPKERQAMIKGVLQQRYDWEKWWDTTLNVALTKAPLLIREEILAAIETQLEYERVPLVLSFAERTEDTVLRQRILAAMRNVRNIGRIKDAIAKAAPSLKVGPVREEMERIVAESPK